MPVQAAFNQRAGGPRILVLAQGLCRVVNALAPVARVKWADRPAFITLLDACQALCAALPAAMDEQAQMDAMPAAAFDPADGTPFPGQITS